jgi:flagellar motor switch protein FliG
MADATGEDVALLLLRVLPADLAESILERLDSDSAARLRERLRSAPSEPPPGPEIDAALAHFFDLRRIVERSAKFLGATSDATAAVEQQPEQAINPIDELRALTPDQLAKALEEEQPSTVAMVLSCLEPAAAGHVMKRMPLEQRAEIALRMTRGGARNLALLQKLAAAVAEKGRRFKELPPEPTQDELISKLADMIRAMPRPERMPVVRKIELTDPEIAAKVVERLYRIEDLVKIPDRQLQGLLAKLDVKTIATALRDVDPIVRNKVTSNMSSRARTVLDEETELLGAIAASRVKEAQSKVLALVLKAEEDGEIVMEE